MPDQVNKVVLTCPKGPCAGEGSVQTSDLLVIVREQAASVSTPVPLETVVTLTALKGQSQQPASRVTGPGGELRVGFDAVKQGWYRALAVKTVAGKAFASAARKVQVVKMKGAPKKDSQTVLLFLSKEGVATFQFVDDLKAAPLANVKARVRHPDGVEQDHLSDASGEIRIPGGTGDVFTVVGVSHPTHSTVADAKLEGGG